MRQLLDLVVDERDIRGVDGGVGDGAALRELDNSGLSGLFGNGDVVLGKELRVARKEGFTVNASGDAASRHHLEVFGLAQRLARLLLTAAGDGLAERVLGIALRRGAEAVELVIGEGGQRAVHQNDLRRAVGQRAGLVEGDLLHGGETLKRVALADEKAVLRRVADGGHDGSRRCQHKRAGAEDDQNRHRADDLTGDEPRQRRGGQGNDDDPCRPEVGKADDLGLVRVGGLDKADHAPDGAVLANLCGLHLESAELVDCAGGDLVADALVDRQRFTRHNGLIHRCLARYDFSVDGDGLAGQHAQQVADLDGLGGDGRFLSAQDDVRGLRCQMDELFDARAGAGDGQLFEKTAELHDERDLTRGEVFADADRRDQRERDEHVRFDVERRDKADDGL